MSYGKLDAFFDRLEKRKKRHGYDFTYIRQTGSLEDFHFTWDLLTAQVDLSEDYMVDVYLSALKSEIERVVRIFNPMTLTEARRLAHMQENVLEKQRGHLKTCSSPLSSLFTKSKPLVNYQNTIISCGQPTSPTSTSFEAYSSTTNSPMEAFRAETPLAREELVLGHSNNSFIGTKKQGKETKFLTPEDKEDEADHNCMVSSLPLKNQSSPMKVSLEGAPPNVFSFDQLPRMDMSESLANKDVEVALQQAMKVATLTCLGTVQSEKSNFP